MPCGPVEDHPCRLNPALPEDPFRLAVGPRALITGLGDPAFPGTGTGHLPALPALADTREFALAIADFATLYDPRDRISTKDACAAVSSGKVTETRPLHCQGQTGGRANPSAKGMAKLACEAWFMASPALLDQFCGAGFGERTAAGWLTGEGLPAWIAFGFNGLCQPGHRSWRPALQGPDHLCRGCGPL